MPWYFCINEKDPNLKFFIRGNNSKDVKLRLEKRDDYTYGWHCVRVSGIGRRKSDIIGVKEVDVCKIKIRNLFGDYYAMYAIYELQQVRCDEKR